MAPEMLRTEAAGTRKSHRPYSRHDFGRIATIPAPESSPLTLLFGERIRL
jgi:hypothetical protein